MSALADALPVPILKADAVIEQTFTQAIQTVRPNFHMGLDLLLAIIPFLISLFIFRKEGRLPSVVWWPLLALMLLFLPNAPYILTDVIHFVAKVRVSPPLPIWAMSLLLIEYFLYFLIGMKCFVVPMMLWERLLRKQQRAHLIIPLEWLVISLSAFGMYLGRVDRLNSWDVVTDPQHLLSQALRDALEAKPKELTLLFFFSVLVVFYLIKGINWLIVRLLRQDSPTLDPSGASRTSPL
jgi:uncharacterized membrane protein